MPNPRELIDGKEISSGFGSDEKSVATFGGAIADKLRTCVLTDGSDGYYEVACAVTDMKMCGWKQCPNRADSKPTISPIEDAPNPEAHGSENQD